MACAMLSPTASAAAAASTRNWGGGAAMANWGCNPGAPMARGCASTSYGALSPALVVGWSRRSAAGWDAQNRGPTGRTRVGRMGVLVVVGRSTNGAQPYRPRPVGTGPRRGQQGQQDSNSGDAPKMNAEIRVPLVRVLDEEQNMLGVMTSSEALQRSREAELDLVMISADADPPVVRMMNYSKYRYELQKKKREAQKKAAASRQVLKELKMRYNIDTHDYAVRQRAAQKFLASGDKVKVVCQFKGRELDFKDLAVKLFQRFQDEIGQLAVVETKISLEGKSMFMVLAPNKAAIQRAQATAQSVSSKAKAPAKEKNVTPGADEAPQKLESPASV